MKKLSFITVTCGLALAIGCGGSDDLETTTLDLTFSNLPELGADHVYEGWVITPDGPVSTGRFADGDPLVNEVDNATLADSTKYVLTIEPATGDDPAPSAVHILAGEIAGSSIILSTSDPAAIGTDFSDAAGDFILATPSTSTIDGDGVQGIWWLVPGEPKAPSLTLPELPEGWVYEGWVVGADGPISTGRFSSADGADSDGAGPTAGDDAAPPYPGQDFIDPALSLAGLTAVITVEPEPDTGAAPFALKPLVTATISDVLAPTAQVMVNDSLASLPSGTVSFR